MKTGVYRGRFAPSPTGPLHAGSLVAALASWLDARAHGGQWLVRLEDVDTPRTMAGATERILQQLMACGLNSDEPVVLQSTRTHHYQQALDTLTQRRLAYACTCSRKDIAQAMQQQGQQRTRNGELVYPGTCRPAHWQKAGAGGQGPCAPAHPVAWRLRTDISPPNQPSAPVEYAQTAAQSVASTSLVWHDRRLGSQQQDVCIAVGDFVLKRADGCFTYQLAVVVDDASQGITHVVRGVDLVDNTARQILLQQLLGLSTPAYLHTTLVMGDNGEKLSKQNGATPLDTSSPQAALRALQAAALALGLPNATHDSIPDALKCWTSAWPSVATCLPTIHAFAHVHSPGTRKTFA